MPIEDKRDEVANLAIENYKNGLNCAESVYDALLRSGALNVPKETLAMCVGFGGGGGMTGHMCGALSAAIMANGALYGRKDPFLIEPDERKKEVAGKYYRRYNKMINDFCKENGTANCKEICRPYGDFSSMERRVSCMKLVGKTAALAYDYLCLTQDEAFSLPYEENIGGMK